MNPYEWILIRPNIIPKGDIDLLLQLKQQDPSFALAGVDSDSQNQNLDTRNTLWYPIPPDINLHLQNCIQQCYHSLWEWKFRARIKSIEAVQYLGYPVGGHYIAHNDSEQIDPVTHKWFRSSPRDISVLAYLTDDYEGGELEFIDLGLTIRPKAGTIIAFPSYHEFTHKVHPVTAGFRDSLVCWIETEERLYGPYE